MKFKVKSLKLKVLILVTLTSYYLLLAPPAYADVKIGEKFGFGTFTSLGQAADKVIDPLMGVATAAVVIYFLFGAFKWITSGGNKEQVAGARQVIMHAIIGFVIIMFAFFIIQFIPQFLNLPGLVIIKY